MERWVNTADVSTFDKHFVTFLILGSDGENVYYKRSVDGNDTHTHIVHWSCLCVRNTTYTYNSSQYKSCWNVSVCLCAFSALIVGMAMHAFHLCIMGACVAVFLYGVRKHSSTAAPVAVNIKWLCTSMKIQQHSNANEWREKKNKNNPLIQVETQAPTIDSAACQYSTLLLRAHSEFFFREVIIYSTYYYYITLTLVLLCACASHYSRIYIQTYT